ncbi:GNAT family N-acetyltransferase [Nocardioides jejuensis]|uniref:N-acetyltransferase n=1 Tax=Nocardioides jejuensis TaxID=2502782 RepID=A0A4R1BZY3_9ACTN|nr:GNAT family N-acetyltransferase [Nocardioides jejuensis]TCJ23651.1 N-acetyltransferase [Nocardioides jejuensis]
MTPTDDALVLRPAEAEDVPDLVDVFLTARAAAPMPASVHSPREIAAFLAARLEVDETWVADVGGVVVGYARFTPTWLDDLYVAPGAQHVGVGTALLELVKTLRPDGFGLWVFTSNLPARAFYAGHGFVEEEHTDGSENEEHAPDVRLSWSVGGDG